MNEYFNGICSRLGSINQLKDEINQQVDLLVGLFEKEDSSLQNLIGSDTYICRQKLCEKISGQRFRECLLEAIYTNKLEELGYWNNISEIIRINQAEIVKTIATFRDLPMTIIPIIPKMNLRELVAKRGSDFTCLQGFHLIDLQSCKTNRGELVQYAINRIYFAPDQEYLVVFVNSPENDLIYQKELKAQGFVTMDLFTAVYIYIVMDLFLKNIYLSNCDIDRQDYFFVLDWISGKYDDKNYNNPTLKIYHDPNIPESRKTYKYIKIFKKS